MQKINNNIAICVATYKRPELLKYCLSKIQLLELPKKNKTILILLSGCNFLQVNKKFNMTPVS